MDAGDTFSQTSILLISSFLIFNLIARKKQFLLEHIIKPMLLYIKPGKLMCIGADRYVYIICRKLCFLILFGTNACKKHRN